MYSNLRSLALGLQLLEFFQCILHHRIEIPIRYPQITNALGVVNVVNPSIWIELIRRLGDIFLGSTFGMVLPDVVCEILRRMLAVDDKITLAFRFMLSLWTRTSVSKWIPVKFVKSL